MLLKYIVFSVILLLSSCVAFMPRTYKKVPEKWVVSRAVGLSFQVKGRTGWYRVAQGDSAVHVGDTLYVNFPGHEAENKAHSITKWRNR
jgi:hypothetical protein